MASMKECVAQACWLLSLIITICFVVFTLTGQTTKAVDCGRNNNSTSHLSLTSPTNSSSQICPNVEHCHIGFFWHLSMTAWARLAICGFSVAGLGLAWVRSTLDDAKPSQAEEWAYKRAFNSFCNAETEFEKAALALKNSEAGSDAEATTRAREKYRRGFELKKVAVDKMESLKPLSGIARVEWRRWTCHLYFFSIVCLVAAALCANVSFYLSMQQELGCVKVTSPWLIPHYAAAAYVLVWGVRFLRVGIRSLP